MRKPITFLLLFISCVVNAQNQDATPYGGIWYNDAQDVRNYGRFVLPRSETSNLDTLTNLVKGTVFFDTLDNRIEYADTNGILVGISGNTLDEAYDQGGVGAGRLITADNGAFQVNGSVLFLDTIGHTMGAYLSANGSDMSIGVIASDQNAKNEVLFNDTTVAVRLDYPTAKFSVQDSLNNIMFSVNRDSNTVINGYLKYVDGNQAAGTFLVSDASGNASWTDIEQTALTAENDTTGLAAEQNALPIGLATFDRLMERVKELETKLQSAGILE